jgi:hypothetical protein
LVEVICDMDDDHQIDEQALRYVRNQRDAAHAEVAALRELVEVQGRNIRREVLADLRTKVDDLESRIEFSEAGHEVAWVRHAEVLALIEEAKP